MKNLKLIASVLCLSMMLVLITGCGGTGNSSKSKGNCELFECMKKIDTNGTIADVNKVIGFEGELTSESDSPSVYKWQLNEDDAIEIRYYPSTKTMYVEAMYSRDALKSKKADFSSVKEKMKAMKSDEGLKYDDVKKIVGGVDGHLVKNDATTLTYSWYNSDGGSFTARFSTTSGKCTSYNGVW